MEPFVSYVVNPDDNVEAGMAIMVKFAYPFTRKVHPYLFVGGGVMYISQHLREQATQYNFSPQAADDRWKIVWISIHPCDGFDLFVQTSGEDHQTGIVNAIKGREVDDCHFC